MANERGRSNRGAIYSRFAADEITVDERDTAQVGASGQRGKVPVPVDRVVDQLARGRAPGRDFLLNRAAAAGSPGLKAVGEPPP